MMIFTSLQSGELQQKRLVFVNKKTGKTEVEAEKPQAQEVPVNEQGQTAYAAEASRLDTEKLETESGDDLSTAQIMQHLTEMRDLRKNGQVDELNRKVMQWYGSHPAVVAAGGTITPSVISAIRTAEFNRFRDLCNDQGKAEYDQITSPTALPNFVAAYAAISGGVMVPGQLAVETQSLLADMNLNNANNAAINLVNAESRKLDIERRLASAKSALHVQEAELTQFKETKANIDAQKAEWDGNKWNWIKNYMAPFTKLVGAGYGAAVGTLGAFGLSKAIMGLGTEATTGFFGTLWGSQATGWGLGTLMSGAVTLTVMKFGAAAAAVAAPGLIAYNYLNLNDFSRRREYQRNIDQRQAAIDAQQEQVRLREVEVKQAQATVEGYKKTSLDNVKRLRENRQKYIDAMSRAGVTDAQENQYKAAIRNINAMITVFRVAEGNNAAALTENPAMVTNPYILDNLRAMGIDEQEDMFKDLSDLAKRQDTEVNKKAQQQIKEIALEGSVEKELPQLSAAERGRVESFFTSPTAGNATAVLTIPFIRKAPRLATVIQDLNGLNDDNVWKVRMCRAFRQSLTDREMTTAQASLMETLKDITSQNSKVGNAVRRNPRKLWDYADGLGTITMPTQPDDTENFDNWIKRLNSTNLGRALSMIQLAPGLDIDANGKMVDLVQPIRKRISDMVNGDTGATPPIPAMNSDVIDILDRDPNGSLSKASKELYGKSGEDFGIPEGATDFVAAIKSLNDIGKLQRISKILRDIKRTAYESGGKLLYVTNDNLNSYQKQISEADLKASITRDITALDAVPNTSGVVNPTGAAVGTSFSDWLQTADVSQRVLLSEKLRNAEAWYYRDRISTVFAGFDTGVTGDPTKDALNDTNIATVREHLEQASRALGSRATFSYLPAGANFEDRMNALSDISKLRKIFELFQKMELRNCRYDGTSWVV